ncbi:hypothetical protein Pcinc_026412 [Petrolisthes cinctipes]|uniref:Uncharacterized protein n=1 Tax=Petrolisthes cinctipes TaxID=88211 RepID=A0AAE1KAD3_PETCI|nr:hypothetical protein Pcinc_026412 [Petrolisthes cinctipes]
MTIKNKEGAGHMDRKEFFSVGETEDEEEMEKVTAGSRVASFFNSTTIHGVGRIYGRGGWWRRGCWLTLWACMTVWALYQITSVALDYAQYPTKITRSSEHERVMEFPAVTLCSLSPLPASRELASHPIWAPFLTYQHTSHSEACDNEEKKATALKMSGRMLAESEDETECADGKKTNTGVCPDKNVAHLRTSGKMSYVQGTDQPTKHRTLSEIPRTRHGKTQYHRLAEDEERLKSTVGRRYDSQHMVKDERGSRRGRTSSLHHLHQTTILLESSRIKVVTQSRTTEPTQTRGPDEDITQETIGKGEVGDLELLEENSKRDTKDDNIKAEEKYSVEKMRRNVMQSLLLMKETNETSLLFPLLCVVTEGECSEGYEKCQDGVTCYREHLACNGWLDCPGGEEETNCSCGESYYQCYGAKKVCISDHLRCDGQPQCLHSDDEANCGEDVLPSEVECQEGSWRCDDGHCIRHYLRCDGRPQCVDGSDEVACGGGVESEEECDVVTGEMLCDGRCLHHTLRCDGRKDCTDNTDELNCEECDEGLYHCEDNTCLPLHLRCDGLIDCTDGDDELNCTSSGVEEECPESHHLCYDWWSYVCLHPHLRCDGRGDCSLSDDEEKCDECGEGLYHCDGNTCIPLHLQCDGVPHCPDADDERNCRSGGKKSVHAGRCVGRSHQCLEEQVCVQPEQVCDGLPDCQDGSDEDNCERCVEGRWLCSEDQRCIYQHQRCDGIVHCSNATDEQLCVPQCDEGFFACKNGKCVRDIFRCDGVDDCEDADDEMACSNCSIGVMHCEDGRCLHPNRRCDGVADCDGAEDERDCSGCLNGLLCQDFWESRCVPLEQLCDGRADCSNGVDEVMCGAAVETCPPGYFKCEDSRCVTGQYRCDGEQDCTQGEDEINCDACVSGALLCDHNHTCTPQHLSCHTCPSNHNCSEEGVVSGECPRGYLDCGEEGGGGCINPRFLCHPHHQHHRHCPSSRHLLSLYCEDVTVLEAVHSLRTQCSQHYRDLLKLRHGSDSSQQTLNQQDTCAGFQELSHWSVLCQAGVFCDHWGCYDHNLTSYQEVTTQPGFLCSKCGGTTDTCWPTPWLDDWAEGRLDNTTLKLMLLRHRADFGDLSTLYSPSHTDQQQYSLPASDFVHSCTFDNELCDFRSFYMWPSDNQGMCYTFNLAPQINSSLSHPPPDPQQQPPLPRTTTRTGPKYGLRVTVNVVAGLNLLTPELGLRVVVHSGRRLPVPQEEGFNVGPGASSISVSRTVFIRAGEPHGRCRHSPHPLLHYSAMLCVDLVDWDYLHGYLYCDCPEPCRETEYHTQVTTSKLNPGYYSLLHQHRKPVNSFCSEESDLAVVHVYLESPSYRLIQESPTYTWESLLSNLGGSLGLFVGVSMVSLMEVLELLLDLLLLLLAFRRPPHLQSSRSHLQSSTPNPSPSSIGRRSHIPGNGVRVEPAGWLVQTPKYTTTGMPQGTGEGGHNASSVSLVCSTNGCQQVGEAVTRKHSVGTTNTAKELPEIKGELEAMKKHSRYAECGAAFNKLFLDHHH